MGLTIKIWNNKGFNYETEKICNLINAKQIMRIAFDLIPTKWSIELFENGEAWRCNGKAIDEITIEELLTICIYEQDNTVYNDIVIQPDDITIDVYGACKFEMYRVYDREIFSIVKKIIVALQDETKFSKFEEKETDVNIHKGGSSMLNSPGGSGMLYSSSSEMTCRPDVSYLVNNNSDDIIEKKDNYKCRIVILDHDKIYWSLECPSLVQAKIIADKIHDEIIQYMVCEKIKLEYLNDEGVWDDRFTTCNLMELIDFEAQRNRLFKGYQVIDFLKHENVGKILNFKKNGKFVRKVYVSCISSPEGHPADLSNMALGLLYTNGNLVNQTLSMEEIALGEFEYTGEKV